MECRVLHFGVELRLGLADFAFGIQGLGGQGQGVGAGFRVWVSGFRVSGLWFEI